MRAQDHPNHTPDVPMLFPPTVERLQIKYLNPAITPLAKRLPGFTIIKHTGRTSGTPYETIVTSYRKGNVFAVLLAYAIVFPNRTIMLLIPPIPMPARVFVGLYAGLELFLGVTGTQSGVAHFAHLGGLLGGWIAWRYGSSHGSGWGRRR